jgi:hypothetical protein
VKSLGERRATARKGHDIIQTVHIEKGCDRRVSGYVSCVLTHLGGNLGLQASTAPHESAQSTTKLLSIIKSCTGSPESLRSLAFADAREILQGGLPTGSETQWRRATTR